jgi:hypothetical protein
VGPPHGGVMALGAVRRHLDVEGREWPSPGTAGCDDLPRDQHFDSPPRSGSTLPRTPSERAEYDRRTQGLTHNPDQSLDAVLFIRDVTNVSCITIFHKRVIYFHIMECELTFGEPRGDPVQVRRRGGHGFDPPADRFGGVVQRKVDWTGLAMFPRESRVCRGWKAVRVPPRAQHSPSSEGVFALTCVH